MELKVSGIHDVTGKIMMTVTFLWIFYRFEQDGAVFLGYQHPWEGHGHGDHGDHHGEEEHHAEPVYQYVKSDTGELPHLVGEGDDDEDDE